MTLGVKRARKPPRHDKAQHQGREDLSTLLKCFTAFHTAFGSSISEPETIVIKLKHFKVQIQ